MRLTAWVKSEPHLGQVGSVLTRRWLCIMAGMRQSSREFDLRQRLPSELTWSWMKNGGSIVFGILDALYHVIIIYKLSKCNLFDKTLIVQIIQLQLWQCVIFRNQLEIIILDGPGTEPRGLPASWRRPQGSVLDPLLICYKLFIRIVSWCRCMWLIWLYMYPVELISTFLPSCTAHTDHRGIV